MSASNWAAAGSECTGTGMGGATRCVLVGRFGTQG